MKPAPIKKDPRYLAAPIEKDHFKDIFRIITQKQNSLTEIFKEPRFVGLQNVQELHQSFSEKFKRLPGATGSFLALVSFSDNVTRQIPSWEKFVTENWAVPERVESLVLRWEFLVQFEPDSKPCTFSVSVRCGSAMNPAIFMQYLLSRDNDDIDSMAIATAPMSCKIDFGDAVISRELLDMVARWQKGLRKPEVGVPGFGFIQKHASKTLWALRHSIVPVTFLVSIAVLYFGVVGKNPSGAVTNGYLAKALVGTCLVIGAMRFASWFRAVLEEFLTSQAQRIGELHTIELTNGDRNKQTELMGQAQRSFYKFIAAGFVAILWNLCSTLLGYYLFDEGKDRAQAPIQQTGAVEIKKSP